MRNNKQPIRSTVFFGLLCGLLMIPIALVLGPVFYWPNSLFVPLWLFAVLYSGVLTRWSSKGIMPTILPLFLIFVALPWVDSITLFMILILGTLSWIRSGVCFASNMGKRIAIEIFLCLLTGGLLVILSPTTLLTWALAVWMFFLVQALYFVFFEIKEMTAASIKPDPFEYAREQAENILATKTQV